MVYGTLEESSSSSSHAITKVRSSRSASFLSALTNNVYFNTQKSMLIKKILSSGRIIHMLCKNNKLALWYGLHGPVYIKASKCFY